MGKDIFSQQADSYAKFRPGYPPELFEYILSFTDYRKNAWDVGTGNGQAAVALSPFFDHVIATDLSEKQLSKAPPVANIEYRVCPADNTNILDKSINLITVAQAYHWFPFDSFAREVRRVAQPGAIIAVWCYPLPVINEKKLNDELLHFYRDVTGPYWDPERKYIENNYEDIPFPFDRLPGKMFNIQYEWNIDQLAGYTSSWSAVQHYINAKGSDPVTDFRNQLKKNWPRRDTVIVDFPIVLLIGQVNS
jgi:SAM-dependent methyltransferase